MRTDREPVAEALRAALRGLARSVAVITCRHDGLRHAMAATAVSELSLDPPAMLVCVNRDASIHAPLAAGADFCINILHASQAEISARCGGQARGEARFDVGAWRDGAGDAPALEDAQARFACRNGGAMNYGTHAIFIGEVIEAFGRPSVDPLVYVDGRYGRIAAPESAAPR